MKIKGKLKLRNHRMANKGKRFEQEVELANKQYKRKGIALIQKISTPWTVIRKGKQIVSAFPEGKSTLDFRGTVAPGTSVSFDCKETIDERGLPLANVQPHQIDYIRTALAVGEVAFILCYMVRQDKRYFISGEDVIHYWDRWKENKGRRGFNFIPVGAMKEVRSKNGILLDYLEAI